MRVDLKILLILCFVFLSQVSLMGQTDSDIDGEVQDAEILIEKERKIELNAEEKLYEFIDWEPNKKELNLNPVSFNEFDYHVLNEDLKLNPASANVKNDIKSYQHYGKAGIGNYASPLLDVSLSSNDHPTQHIGLNFKHESFGSGEVDGENSGSADTELNLYGAVIQENIKLESGLNYSLEKNYYYGYPTGSVVDKDDIKHKANFFNFDISALDRDTDSNFDYRFGLDAQHYSDNFNAKENVLAIGGNGSYGENIFLNSELKLSSYKDTGIDISRTYFRLSPHYRLLIDNLTLDLGISLNFQNDDAPGLNSSKLLPFARLSYPLTPDYTIFAQLDGGYDFNALYQFASEVGVLNQSVAILNSEKLIDFSGGIMGNAMDNLSLQASMEFQTVKYLPVLTNNAVDQSRLDINYDTENTNILTLKAKAQFLFTPDHELSFGVNYYNYSSDSYNQIYHRPTSEITLSGDHQIIPKFNAKWGFTYQGGIYGQNLVLSDPDIKLDAIAKLDLSLHFQIREDWGVFLSGENLLNQNYSRYLNYPQRGIQIRGGVTFRL